MTRLKNPINIFFLIILFSASVFSQIKIKELSNYVTGEGELYQNTSPSREIISLHKKWNIFLEDSPNNKKPVTVPNTFIGVEELIYETEFSLSRDKILSKLLFLNITGINYSAEIFVNEEVISKLEFGQIPERLEIPREILTFDKKNKLVIKVTYKPDDINTIPVNKGFLSPESHGGIYRDVYLELVPNPFITIKDKSYSFGNGFNSAQIKLDYEIHNRADKSDTLEINNSQFELNYTLYNPSGQTVDNLRERVNIRKNEITKKIITGQINSPDLWSPSEPNVYKAKLTLLKNNSIIDEIEDTFSFYDLSKNEDRIQLNGGEFQLRGCGYFYSDSLSSDNLPSFKDHRKLLDKIKSTGFNSVRFKNSFPSFNSLKYCEKIGLFVLVDIPLNSIPENISTDKTFIERSQRYTSKFYSYYKRFNAVAFWGLGNSYLADSREHSEFIKKLILALNGNPSKYKYASFIGLQTEQISEIDFYGVELYSKDSGKFINSFVSLNSPAPGNYFISEINYAVFDNQSVGYINPNTVEAQAKFIDGILEFVKDKKLSGIFIKSLYDYKGSNSSFFSSYNPERIYKVGILGKNRNETNPSFQVINSFLKDQGKVRVPIGSKKEDRALLFIISALILAVFMGLLINSKRKFREDASRALIRPYNFFADIRDLRIISGIHTNILMIIIVLTHALLLTNLLYYWRSNLFIEKFLIAFNSTTMLNFISKLAWNPETALIYFSIFSVGAIILLSLTAKLFTVFIKTRVMLSSIYFTIIWAWLPLTLILPLLLLLYKVLLLGTANYFIYGFLGIYFFWMTQRLLKGIYIIFDVPSFKVYFYSLLLFVFIVGGTLLYFHLSESTIYYLINSYKQFLLI
ncbi:MAG: hypothetical protein PVH88_03385 [Ignavibacteria bacterium]|jgi:beta-galactosidase